MANERPRYEPAAIEPKWQARWEADDTFRAERRPGRPKKYILDMFPYPSGAGLHVGHPEGYTATDILARYYRTRGFDVLHPMGWDAFGLPAEQFAIKAGVHPALTTRENIATFKRQMKSLGFSYDWGREIDTTDPSYVKWTQWVFLKLFRRGLAYQSAIPVNWCPALGTVLANEEVTDGRSERGQHPVVRLPLRQWLLRITAYADRLAEGLSDLDWPDTKQKQINWIGRSEGVELAFALEGHDGRSVRVFTTRPDTLYGVTYLVLAPEHPLIDSLTTGAQRAAVDAYRARVASRSDLARTSDKGEKTGVFTGGYALHPLTGARLPVWVADFVLGTYGTGAVMSVPAHDERDFAFARAFSLPVVEVVSPDGESHEGAALGQAYTDDGVAVRSPMIDGLPTPRAKTAMTEHLVESGIGERRIQYKLRDWVFSRQRYWGEPIPIYFPVDLAPGVTDPRRGEHVVRYDRPLAVDESELPLRLPEVTDFSPGDDPAGVLARAVDWRYFQRAGAWFARETNTMPQWAGSCWYYLRFCDPQNKEAPFSPAAYADWMPVDLYVGGSEHAVLHLLYARFWHKVLFDEGIVADPEPFTKLVHQGMILGYSYRSFRTRGGDGERLAGDDPDVALDRDRATATRRSTGEELDLCFTSPEAVIVRDRVLYDATTGVRLERVTEKMSKSRGNVVNPDDVVREYGADAFRLYEMFLGPLEQVKPWQTEGISGVRRFLDRAWSVSAFPDSEAPVDDETRRLLHRTVKKVTDDIEAMRFNTAISSLMVLVNRFHEVGRIPPDLADTLARLLGPFAPHLAEELWQRLGHTESLAYEPWPTFDPSLVVDDTVEIGVQVNGKVRSRVRLRVDATEADARSAVTGDAAVRVFTDGKVEKRFLYVPGKIINIVVG